MQCSVQCSVVYLCSLELTPQVEGSVLLEVCLGDHIQATCLFVELIQVDQAVDSVGVAAA